MARTGSIRSAEMLAMARTTIRRTLNIRVVLFVWLAL